MRMTPPQPFDNVRISTTALNKHVATYRAAHWKQKKWSAFCPQQPRIWLTELFYKLSALHSLHWPIERSTSSLPYDKTRDFSSIPVWLDDSSHGRINNISLNMQWQSQLAYTWMNALDVAFNLNQCRNLSGANLLILMFCLLSRGIPR